MIVGLVVLALLAGAGWSLVVALLLGGACRLRDAGGPPPVVRVVEPTLPAGLRWRRR